jgi:hypothetical protein
VQVARNLEFLHRPGSDLNNESPIFDSQGLAPGGRSAIMASSSRCSRRVLIGYLVLAKAAEAGGDQTTPSRPPPAALGTLPVPRRLAAGGGRHGGEGELRTPRTWLHRPLAPTGLPGLAAP